MRGVIFIHAETGTEGGWLAFQDAKHIGTRTEQRCRKCAAWWHGDENEPDGDRRIGDFVMRSCKRGEHDVGPVELPSWDYAGLYVLQDGDFLTIYDKDALGAVLWTGEIALVHPPLSDGMRTRPAYRVPPDFMRWFSLTYPALLTRKAKA